MILKEYIDHLLKLVYEGHGDKTVVYHIEAEDIYEDKWREVDNLPMIGVYEERGSYFRKPEYSLDSPNAIVIN